MTSTGAALMMDTTGTRSTAVMVYNLVILAVARVYYFTLWISPTSRTSILVGN
ncbi:hypothetical protein PISMIDRAFT_688746, partial [Pisolithus microcarpus 441]